MRDTKLFQYIQSLIRERHNSSPTQPTTFAERYCKQQMMKKKLNVNNSGQKMQHLMRNFQGLETFVDLPEMIEAVKLWRFNQIMRQKQQLQKQSQQQQRQSLTFNKRRQVKSLSLFKYQQYWRTEKCLELQSKLKKELGQKMKSKYMIQNGIVDDLISSLQKTTTINSEVLKNDSPNNINMMYQRMADEGDDTNNKEEMGFLDCLNSNNPGLAKMKQDNKNRISDWIELQKSDSQDHQLFETSLKLRKQYSKLLHKITTYIQIALQMQHRQKWESKSQSHHTHKLHKNVFNTHHSDNDKENHLLICGNINNGNNVNTNNNNTDINLNNNISNNSSNNSSNNISAILFHPVTSTASNKSKDKFHHPIAHNTSTSNMIKVKSKFFNQQYQQPQSNSQSVAFVQKEQKHNMFIQSGSTMTKLKKKPVFLHRRQFSQYPEQVSINTDQNDTDIRKTTTSIVANTPNNSRTRSNLRTSEGNDSFLRTTSSSILRQSVTRIRKADFKSEGKQSTTSSFSISNNLQKQSFSIKENFTFRNRNIKQRIIKRLDSFIREIEDQQQNNKKQNHFYMNAMNKLQNTLGLTYGKFKQEDVVEERDIQTVTKYAKLYGNGSARPGSPSLINSDDELGDQKKSKTQIN